MICLSCARRSISLSSLASISHQVYNTQMIKLRTYFIPGEPLQMTRQRFARGRSYHVKKTSDFLKMGAEFIELENRSGPHSGADSGPVTGPVIVFIEYFCGRPGRLKRKSSPSSAIYKDTTPDIDNKIKMTLDILQKGGAFADDKTVVGQIAFDFWTSYDFKTKTQGLIGQSISIYKPNQGEHDVEFCIKRVRDSLEADEA